MHAQAVVLPNLEIRELRIGDDGSAFRTLNEEWITHHFVLEEHDKVILNDPENEILRAGGQVLFGYLNGEPVACVALIPTGGGVYELSKMAVVPYLRGLGIGRRLLEHTVQQARLLGARRLFLGSNRKLANAVHLYESLGFSHVPAERVPALQYSRANVFMEMVLEPKP